MAPCILIPCKPLNEGKSRLAPILSAADRQALCADLLRRSLDLALGLQAADRVSVITPDPMASAIAAERRVAAIDDGGAGLNEALHRGRAGVIGEHGEDGSLLVLPIDLPCATAAAVQPVIVRECDIALVPDAERRGTNLLYLGSRVARIFPFAFGPDSFVAHRRWAERQGLRVAVIEDPLLTFDVDRPEDYLRWQRASKTLSHPFPRARSAITTDPAC
jgi:2-phospho-L-lactate guanylyltransferase